MVFFENYSYFLNLMFIMFFVFFIKKKKKEPDVLSLFFITKECCSINVIPTSYISYHETSSSRWEGKS